MSRKSILDRALAAVGKRHAHYGDPIDNFQAIAQRWKVHIENRHGIIVEIDERDVAVMMIDVKLARLEHDPTHKDSWVDVAGYAACGGEVSE